MLVHISLPCFKLQRLPSVLRKKAKLNDIGSNSLCLSIQTHNSPLSSPLFCDLLVGPLSCSQASVPAPSSAQHPVLLPYLDQPYKTSWSGCGALPTDSHRILHNLYHRTCILCCYYYGRLIIHTSHETVYSLNVVFTYVSLASRHGIKWFTVNNVWMNTFVTLIRKLMLKGMLDLLKVTQAVY